MEKFMQTKMDQIDNSIRNQIAALTRVISLTRCFKEDNVPCKIEEVLKLDILVFWFFGLLSSLFLLSIWAFSFPFFCFCSQGLYLGSIGAANNKDALKALNITHILTVAKSMGPSYPNDFVYKVVPGMHFFLWAEEIFFLIN